MANRTRSRVVDKGNGGWYNLKQYFKTQNYFGK